MPATGDPKLIADVLLPLQSAWSVTLFTVGVGLTLINAFCEGPLHPKAVGMILIEAILGLVPVFTPVKAEIFPVPLPAKPMVGSLFVHE